MKPLIRTCVGLTVLLLGTVPLTAQVTTGTLAGVVVAEEEGTGLPGASLTALHVPTGTQYSTDAQVDGRFALVNVRVGGPYSLTASLEGFQQKQVTDLWVALGQTTEITITLPLATVEETVTVVGEAAPLITSSRMGAATGVSAEQIQTLPTIERTLQDLARTNPYFVVDPGDQSSTRLQVAGRNNRYNTIQIDGAVNNDLFGLADTGTPGGQSDAQPISLDAVQELKLDVSPYDVRQAGFTGGVINAITRSGSNEFHGSVYGSSRDEDSVGDFEGREISAFEDEQYGFRLGGPIQRDRLFFFVNAEINSNENPTGFSADGSAPNQFRNPALAQEVGDVLRTQYGFDPGGLGEFVEGTDSDLAFGRLDWNAAANHQLTLRHNFVDAEKDRIESGSRNSATRFAYPSYYYLFTSETNSTVAQLNSTFSNLFNEARLNFTTIKDLRTIPERFPDVVVRQSGLEVDAGINRFSHRNALDQDILEITDDVTWVRGKHTWSFGTHNELFTFSNLFLEGSFGAYTFNSLADLEAGRATGGYVVSFSNTGKDTTEFDVYQYGIYGGDQWRVRDDLTINYGLRLDLPTFPDTPGRNQLVFSALGIDTSDTPETMQLIQPRFGFNWAPPGDVPQQLRGGVGIFGGRTPYVWMSNNYQNSGVEFTRLSTSSTVNFVADPDQAPRTGTGGTPVIDAVDPDFEFPQVLRTTLGYDRELPGGVEGTVEVLYSQSVEDAVYENRNIRQSGTLPDGRPRFTRIDPRINAVYFLRNTSDGEEYSASLRLAKRFGADLDFTGLYIYNQADSVADLTSSRAVSNYRFAPQVDPLNPRDATSFFETEHRIVFTAAYRFNLGVLGNTIALFYSGQSGNPYSLVMPSGNDINSDGADGNDLLFIPANPGDVLLSGTTQAALDAFINSEECFRKNRGRVFERNSCQAPWLNQLDLHYGLSIPVRRVETEVTFDLLNLLNLIDSNEGHFETVPFNTYAPIRASVDAATGKWVYTPAFSGSLTPGRQFSANNTRSRYQFKLGLRVSF